MSQSASNQVCWQRYMRLVKGVAGLQVADYVKPVEEKEESTCESDKKFEEPSDDDQLDSDQDEAKELKSELNMLFSKMPGL